MTHRSVSRFSCLVSRCVYGGIAATRIEREARALPAYPLAAIVGGVILCAAALQGQSTAPADDRGDLPRLLSETGLYSRGSTSAIDPRNRPYTPQYPLWSDGARKARWVWLPPGAAIDATDIDGWQFPVGTRFWKEFTFGGRKVETRLIWKADRARWVFASYVWNDAQTDAELAPAGGVPDLVEIAPGRRHSIPSVNDCLTCHEPSGTHVLGFSALQLSTDRDPNAVHAEPLPPGAMTLRTLVDERLLQPSQAGLLADPPRIRTANPRTRAMLGYLSANCGNCHNAEGPLASIGLVLKQRSSAAAGGVLDSLIGRPGRWTVPEAPEGASAMIHPGAPEWSAILYRMRSRRPSSQMPPLGTVLPDAAAIEMMTAWIREDVGAPASITSR